MIQLSSAVSLNLGWSQNGVLRNGVTLSQTSPGFYVCSTSLLKTLGKGEIARND